MFQGDDAFGGFEDAAFDFGIFFSHFHELFAERCPEVLRFADEEEIDAGAEPEADGFEAAVVVNDGVHFEVVADDDAVKAEFFAQELGDDGVGKCGGEAFAESLHDDVGGHDHGDLCLNGGLEGLEFDVAQASEVMLDDRCVGMAVEIRVPVSWEVFAAGNDAFGEEAVHEGDGVVDDILGGCAEGAVADDGVLRVGVDVEDGGEVEVEAEFADSSGESARIFKGLFRRAFSNFSGGGEFLDADVFGKALDFAAFLIDGDPCWEAEVETSDGLRECAQLVGIGDVSPEEDDASDFIFKQCADERRGEGCALKADDEKLANGLFKRECSHDSWDTPSH